jgi:hypothetical protein
VAGIAVLRFWFIRKLAQARQALAQSQERVRLILRSSQIAVWNWEIVTKIIHGGFGLLPSLGSILKHVFAGDSATRFKSVRPN